MADLALIPEAAWREAEAAYYAQLAMTRIAA